jgi:N-acetylglucosamine-6-phosphate deacetylase
VSTLAVVGGTVLAPGGPVRSDVFVAAGRIVSELRDVGTTGTGHGGSGGRNKYGTVGAGAERSVVDAPAIREVVPVVGGGSPAAGGDAAVALGDVAAERVTRLDATGLLVAPGFIDLQINGAAGVDLSTEPERMAEVAGALPRWGVTAWLPTVVTGPPSVRRRALAAFDALASDASSVAAAGTAPGIRPGAAPGAVPLGLHLEGPFLAPERKGAHDPAHLTAPTVDVVADEAWSRDAGVAAVTLAPELPGALDVVRELVARGVVVSAGHSSATAAEATAAIDAGVTYVTHLFNAMAPLHHREPGLVGVALSDDRVRVGVIADGLHVDPAVVALAARALGSRLSLVTDAVAALGAPAGPVALGPFSADVSPDDGAVRLRDGTLAGSTLALDRAVRNVVSYAGLPLADAVSAVTATPAALLGLADRGVVEPGAVGDLVLLTPDGDVVATVVGGRVVHDVRAAA